MVEGGRGGGGWMFKMVGSGEMVGGDVFRGYVG